MGATEPGSDIIALYFGKTSGGTIDNGLQDTGGRETHSKGTVPNLVCSMAGRLNPISSLSQSHH